MIAEYVIAEDQTGAGTPVDNTTIPDMFDVMLLRLVEEERERGVDDTVGMSPPPASTLTHTYTTTPHAPFCLPPLHHS